MGLTTAVVCNWVKTTSRSIRPFVFYFPLSDWHRHSNRSFDFPTLLKHGIFWNLLKNIHCDPIMAWLEFAGQRSRTLWANEPISLHMIYLPILKKHDKIQSLVTSSTHTLCNHWPQKKKKSSITVWLGPVWTYHMQSEKLLFTCWVMREEEPGWFSIRRCGGVIVRSTLSGIRYTSCDKPALLLGADTSTAMSGVWGWRKKLIMLLWFSKMVVVLRKVSDSYELTNSLFNLTA